MKHSNKELYKIVQSLAKQIIFIHKKKNAIEKALTISPYLGVSANISDLSISLLEQQKILKSLDSLYDLNLSQNFYTSSLNEEEILQIETDYIKSGNKFYYFLYRRSK